MQAEPFGAAHDLSTHPGIVVEHAAMTWVFSVVRLEAVVVPHFGTLGQVRAVLAEGWGATRDAAMFDALCKLCDGVRRG